MTDAERVAADILLIEAGTYEIPLVSQTTQDTKTAWVQNAVDSLIANESVATVIWALGYSVSVTSGEVTEEIVITVTEESWSNATILAKVKLRLGIVYSDSLKDLEIAGRIDACVFDLLNAGVPQANLSSELAMDTIERYINGGQNDSIYIANVLKLRGTV